MRCSKFRKAVLPLLMKFGDERGLALHLAKADVRLRGHLDSCDRCRSYLRSCREALGCLGSLEVEMPDERRWAEVREKIHRAVRKKAPVYRIAWPYPASVSWGRVAACATVALVLFAVSLVYFRPEPIGKSFPRPIRLATVPTVEEVDLAFLDEIETSDREYDEFISEIDELMREINTVYARIDIDTGELSLNEGRFDNILA